MPENAKEQESTLEFLSWPVQAIPTMPLPTKKGPAAMADGPLSLFLL
jgi:hypothetical protein